MFTLGVRGQGRRRADDSAFVTILSGTHTRAVDALDNRIENYGSGTFVDRLGHGADAARARQRAWASRRSRIRASRRRAVTTIDVDFKGIKDDPPATELYDAIYRYTATPGAGGELQVRRDKRDTIPIRATAGTAKEDFTIHSRWQETGAGRTDYQLTGGDVAATGIAPVTVSECWDTASCRRTGTVVRSRPDR